MQTEFVKLSRKFDQSAQRNPRTPIQRERPRDSLEESTKNLMKNDFWMAIVEKLSFRASHLPTNKSNTVPSASIDFNFLESALEGNRNFEFCRFFFWQFLL